MALVRLLLRDERATETAKRVGSVLADHELAPALAADAAARVLRQRREALADDEVLKDCEP